MHKKNNLELEIILSANKYSNFNNMHLFLPVKIKSKANNYNDTAAGTIPVNNCFAHWIKKVDIKRYEDNVPIVPLKTIKVYRYSDEMLKHLPKDALKTFEYTLICSKSNVTLTSDRDRRLNNTNTPLNRTNPKLTERITKFQNIIKEENVHKIPLKLLVDLGLGNFPFKFNTKFLFTLEANINRLFESNAKMEAIPNTVDAEIIFYFAHYIFYEQFQLEDNFCTYLEKTLISNRALSTGTKSTAYQRSYEINTGVQSFAVDFRGANKQFLYLCTSLVYHQSDQHNTIFDSYNIEVETKKIKTLTLENTANTYSVFNGVKFDLEDEHDKYLLHPQFLAGCVMVLVLLRSLIGYIMKYIENY